MKFGKSAEEAAKEPSRGGGGGYIKAMKDGDTTLHLMDEPHAWLWYWEHFNPDGYSFPCTNERDTCPGCTSDNEKMQKASRKVVLNAWDGQYTNVWKLAKTVADKLENRYKRSGTVTDRPYIITRLKDGQKYDYDLEGQEKQEIPAECEENRKDLESMLAAAYEQEWGDSAKVEKAKPKQSEEPPAWAKDDKPKIERSVPKEEPKKDVVTEADLRAMAPGELRVLCVDEKFGEPPEKLKTSASIVDWMLEQ